MQNIDQYCSILGVQPGDSADKVKSAFRNRIKLAHPDVSGSVSEAQKVIEAYEALKEGVPVPRTEMEGGIFVGGVRINPATGRPYRKAATVRTTRSSFAEKAGEELGRKIFEAMQGSGITEDDIRAFLRAQRQKSEEDDFPGMQYFRRAENSLRETVNTFDRQKGRSKKFWARDYIGKLLQVQVLFRDVIRRYPVIAERARVRVLHIDELIRELRVMAR